jgi:carbamoyltransferase
MGYFLGLGGPYYHDASACLVSGTGDIVAFAEEERFTRRKRNQGLRTCSMSAAWCLAKAGLRLEDVDEIAVAWNPAWPEPCDAITDSELIRELLDPRYLGGHLPTRLTIVEHHLAHAASAFYCSGFTEAAVLVADGAGDGVATSLYRFGPEGHRRLRAYPYTQSLGFFYESVGEHLGLGDGTSCAGKLMGLAAYGSPVYDLPFLRIGHEGGYRFDLGDHGLTAEEDARGELAEWAFYLRQKKVLGAIFESFGVPPHVRPRRYDSESGRFVPEAGYSRAHADLAATAQAALEESLLVLARSAMAEAGSDNLCIAGGVGFNCAANGRVHRDGGARRLFVQPVAGDAGCAIGAALMCARQSEGRAFRGASLGGLALGPTFTDADIEATLKATHVRYSRLEEKLATEAARRLTRGEVIGWFQGAAEAGPRALGQRSILADPRQAAQRHRVNGDIKRREMWRPFAPSLLASAAGRYLRDPGPSEFMIVACRATDEARAAVPAVVHVDGTVRPQAVSDTNNPLYAAMIGAFADETGVPVVLNTSFNREDEPIVCTPLDALRTFYATPLDALFIGGFMVSKA